MKWLIYSRDNGAMVARTGLEVILSWFLANLPEIFNLFTMSSEVKTLIIGFLTVVISWVLSVIRGEEKK